WPTQELTPGIQGLMGGMVIAGAGADGTELAGTDVVGTAGTHVAGMGAVGTDWAGAIRSGDMVAGMAEVIPTPRTVFTRMATTALGTLMILGTPMTRAIRTVTPITDP